MCNLYTVRKSAAEVAAHFGVRNPIASNAPEEVYPGTPGMVVREAGKERIVQSMAWGFPLRLKGMSPTAKPKPVNNIADLSKPMWKGLAAKPQWRCLIPLTGFAEAEGPKGSKTRTWFNVKDQPIFAWAGLWRVSDEWGPVYSGVMTDCNEAIRPIHDRMPVLLHSDEYDQWLQGTYDDALKVRAADLPEWHPPFVATVDPPGPPEQLAQDGSALFGLRVGGPVDAGELQKLRRRQRREVLLPARIQLQPCVHTVRDDARDGVPSIPFGQRLLLVLIEPPCCPAADFGSHLGEQLLGIDAVMRGWRPSARSFRMFLTCRTRSI
jgi:putative SOS response-associated peptidase YedK